MIVRAKPETDCTKCGSSLPPGQYVIKILNWSGGFNVSPTINLKNSSHSLVFQYYHAGCRPAKPPTAG